MFLTAVGAILAAVFASKSAKETAKTVKAQVIMQLTGAYSSEEMQVGMNEIRRFKEKHKEGFADKYQELLSARMAGKPLNCSDSECIDHLDKARRRFSHHFHNIRFLLDTEVVEEKLVKKIVECGQVQFLLYTVQPLEKAHSRGMGLKFDPRTFDRFKDIFPECITRTQSGEQEAVTKAEA